VPALWEARWISVMLRCLRSAGIVSRKTGMRWETGTGVEPPNAGLNWLSAEIQTFFINLLTYL
jgi:hypothetical protein